MLDLNNVGWRTGLVATFSGGAKYGNTTLDKTGRKIAYITLDNLNSELYLYNYQENSEGNGFNTLYGFIPDSGLNVNSKTVLSGDGSIIIVNFSNRIDVLKNNGGIIGVVNTEDNGGGSYSGSRTTSSNNPQFDISDDGNTIIIGDSGLSNNRGRITVYKYDSVNNRYDQDLIISGVNSGDLIGQNLCFSKDGNTLFDGESQIIRHYNQTTQIWDTRNLTGVTGSTNNNLCSFNFDGSILVVHNGNLQFLRYNPSTNNYEPFTTIATVTSPNISNYRITNLNYTGDKIIVYRYNALSNNNEYRLYEYNGTTYNQIGQTYSRLQDGFVENINNLQRGGLNDFDTSIHNRDDIITSSNIRFLMENYNSGTDDSELNKLFFSDTEKVPSFLNNNLVATPVPSTTNTDIEYFFNFYLNFSHPNMGLSFNRVNQTVKNKIYEFINYGFAPFARNGFQMANLSKNNFIFNLEPGDPGPQLLNNTSLEGCYINCNASNYGFINPIDYSNVTSFESCFENSNINQEINFTIPNTTTLSRMFYNCTNLSSNVSFQSTTSLIDVSFLFFGCTAFNQPFTLNCPSITTMESFFNGCTSLNSTVSFTNTNSLTNVANFFLNCSNLQTLPATIWSNTSLIETFERAFRDTTSLTSSITLNCQSCTNMYQTFRSSNSPSITLTNTNNVQTFEETFFSNSNLQTVSFGSTASATTMRGMLNNCPNLNSPVTLDCTACTEFDVVFTNSTSLTNVTLLNTQNITTMESTFEYCTSLNSTINLDCNSCTTLRRAFFQCNQLTTLNLSNTENVINMDAPFVNCLNLNSTINLDCNSCITLNSAFRECSQLTTVNLTNTQNIINLSNTFLNCSNLNSTINLNCASVVSLISTFQNCGQITTINISNTENVLDMRSIFENCTSLNSTINLNCNSCTKLNSAFRGCSQITTVNISNTQNIIIMDSVFRDCSNLNSTINLDCQSCTSFSYTFSGCSQLTTVNLTNATLIQNLAYAFASCNNLSSTINIPSNNLTNLRSSFAGCQNITTVN